MVDELEIPRALRYSIYRICCIDHLGREYVQIAHRLNLEEDRPRYFPGEDS